MLQDLADQLSARGLSPSSVRNTILPLRAIYRRAHQRGDVAINPTLKLAPPRRPQPTRPHRRTHTKPPPSSTRSHPADRALWATALYAGLRLGELQALHWNDIDLDHNLIHIQRSWDRTAGFIATQKPRRQPPRPHHQHPPHATSSTTASTKAQAANGFVFPNQRGDHPFNPSTINPQPAKPGQTPASPRSASTNAATPTPPT